MTLKAYSIYDCKSYIWHSPFFMTNDGAALRACTDLANDTGTMIGRHPADYTLWCVGEFNDQDGLMAAQRPALHVVDLVTLVNLKQKEML